MKGSWKIRSVTLLFILAWAQVHTGIGAHAQSTGKLRILCEPVGTSSYVVDSKHRMNDREITLMEGAHRLVFWAPERRMLDTTVMVVAGTTKEVRAQLRYSEEYIAYRAQADRFVRNDRWLKYGTPVVTAGAGVWAGVSIARAIDARKDLDALQDEYTSSADPGGLLDLKSTRIPDANDALRRSRTMAYVSSGVFALSACALWYVNERRKEHKAPVFEDKEKVRFEGLVWVPGSNTGGTWAMGLTIPIR